LLLRKQWKKSISIFFKIHTKYRELKIWQGWAPSRRETPSVREEMGNIEFYFNFLCVERKYEGTKNWQGHPARPEGKSLIKEGFGEPWFTEFNFLEL
jgi:hypothetical protein